MRQQIQFGFHEIEQTGVFTIKVFVDKYTLDVMYNINPYCIPNNISVITIPNKPMGKDLTDGIFGVSSTKCYIKGVCTNATEFYNFTVVYSRAKRIVKLRQMLLEMKGASELAYAQSQIDAINNDISYPLKDTVVDDLTGFIF